MTVLAAILPIAGRLIAAEGHEYGIDSEGHITSQSAIFPDKAELIYGTLASLIIFFRCGSTPGRRSRRR